MSKYNTIDVWNHYYGKKEDVKDYAGRLMKKSACGNPNSKFHPTLEHIRPLTKGGSDVLENIIICHRDTNEEKGDKFPAWKANGRRFHAIRVRGSRTAYKIVEDNDDSYLLSWLR